MLMNKEGDLQLENEKFQELVIEQFAKIFKELQEVRGEFRELKTELKGGIQELVENQLRLEAKFDLQITALHDLRVSQEDASINVIEKLDRIERKVEVLQLETAHIRRVSDNGIKN